MKQGWQSFHTGPYSKYFSLSGHYGFCCKYTTKVIIDDKQMSMHGCAPIKPYLQNSEVTLDPQAMV
jgi:hypothetical protein